MAIFIAHVVWRNHHEKRLQEHEGIGEHLAEKISTLATTGSHPAYEKLKTALPQTLMQLLEIPGLGSKKIKALYDNLKVKSISDLKEACATGKVGALAGFGEKSEKKILDAISHLESYTKRYLWWDAMQTITPIVDKMKRQKGVGFLEVAGSLRRKLETVGDIDLVASCEDPKRLMDWFTSQDFVEQVIAHGLTKSSIRLKGGMQIELRIVPKEQFAFTLLYSTGSKEHNIRVRHLANRLGHTLSEWGLQPIDPKTKPLLSPKKMNISEEDVLNALGLDYIEPELRENMGEVEAAEMHMLPQLITEGDIRGTFHVHTAASNGENSLEEMVKAAQKLGWEYIGISDHSKSSFQANGLTEERLHEQVEKIKAMNASKKYGIHIFSGTECDILSDGTLDYSDALLQELDFVIVSVHSSFQLDEMSQTRRLIRAIEHPLTTMVGHVTGRLLLKRQPIALDMQKVIDACIANGKIIELNAYPQRLDMDWRFWHKASEKGLLCAINPDAHDIAGLDFIRAGVNVARKGWLEKKHVVNCQPLNQVNKLLNLKTAVGSGRKARIF